MKKEKLFFAAAFAALFTSCAQDEIIQGTSMEQDKLGTLIEAPILGVNAGGVESRAYVESEGKPGTWQWLPKMSGTDIESVDNIGLCWTGVNNNGAFGGPLSETGDMVYTNVKFEHIGWLYEDEEKSDFHCGNLENGEYTGWMGMTSPLATYSTEWTATDATKELDLAHALFKSQNGTIYQGEYIVYFPYNDGFWNAPVTAKQDRIMDVTISSNAIEDQRELMSKYAFNIGYRSDIQGGADAEDFSTKMLSSGIELTLNGAVNFEEIVLWAKGGEKAFLTSQALSAKQIKSKYNSGLTTDVYLTGADYEDINEASSSMVIRTTGLNATTSQKLVIPFLPNKFKELHVMFVKADGKVADLNLGAIEFKAGEIRPMARFMDGTGVKKASTDRDYLARFTEKNYAYDEASFKRAFNIARNSGASGKTNKNTVMLLDDILLTDNTPAQYNTTATKVYVESDETLAEGEKNTLSFAPAKTTNQIIYTFVQTSFDVNLTTVSQGCCNNGPANLSLKNSETLVGTTTTINGGILKLMYSVTLNGEVYSKFEGVDEEGDMHPERVPVVDVCVGANVVATADVEIEGNMFIHKNVSSPAKFTLKGADMTIASTANLTVEGEGTTTAAELIMVKNGTVNATITNNGTIENMGSIDNNSAANTFKNGANATFIDYVGSSLSGHRLVNTDATSEFISEVNSLVRYNNAIDLEGIRPTTIVRFVSNNIGSGDFTTTYTLVPNMEDGIYCPYPAGGVDRLIDFESTIEDSKTLKIYNGVDEENEPIATEIGNVTIKSGKVDMIHEALTVDGDYLTKETAVNTYFARGLVITGDLNLNKLSTNCVLKAGETLTIGGDINVVEVAGTVTFKDGSILNAKNLNVATTNTVVFEQNQVTFLGKGIATAGVLTNNGTVNINDAVSGSNVAAKVWCNARAGEGSYPINKPQYYAK